MYHAPLGRFVSRDPAVKDGFYQYAESGPLQGTDPSGLWVVEGNNESKAGAVTKCGDTIKHLALKIGLDRNEWQKWLTYSDSTVIDENSNELSFPGGLTANTKLAGGQTFQIPNTVAMFWALGPSRVVELMVGWPGDRSYMQNRGFKIDERNGTNTTPVEFVLWMRELTEKKKLHGLQIQTHGRDGDFSGPDFLLFYSNFGPPAGIRYHLALVNLNACDSEYGAQTLCADCAGSICLGHEGDCSPSGWWDTTPVWNVEDFLKPGDQMTRGKGKRPFPEPMLPGPMSLYE